MIWQHFHFIRPYWLLAILPLLLLVFLQYRQLKKRNAWHTVCDPALLSFLLKGQRAYHHGPILWLALVWLLSVLALAGPSWRQLETPLLKNQMATVLLFDNSYMMDASDIPPSRLVRARYKVLDILHLAQDGRFGLIAYAGEPYVVTPLTDDMKPIENFIPQLSPNIMPVSGHRLDTALLFAANLLKQADETKGIVIVITGNNATTADINAANKIAKQGYKTFVLGIGSSRGGPVLLPNGAYLKDEQGNIVIAKLDATSLERLAAAGNGTYEAYTRDDHDVRALLKAAKTLLHTPKAGRTQQQMNQWQDDGRWLFILILPLFLFGFRRSWLMELLP